MTTSTRSEIDRFLKMMKDRTDRVKAERTKTVAESDVEKFQRLLDEAVAVGAAREERIIAYHMAIVRAIETLETGRVAAAVKLLRDAVAVRSA